LTKHAFLSQDFLTKTQPFTLSFNVYIRGVGQPQSTSAQPHRTVAPPTAIATTETERKEKIKKRRAFPPVAPENLPPSYFVSATYDGRLRKALIKLYEPESGKIYFWYDNTGHKPYCLTNLSPYELEKIDRLKKNESFNPVKHE
jgi:hypothetical protein